MTTKWDGLNIVAEGAGITPELSRVVNLLGSILGHAIRQQAGDVLFQQIETARISCKNFYSDHDQAKRNDVIQLIGSLSDNELEWLIRSFTAFFHLINKAEQEEIVRINKYRLIKSEKNKPKTESISDAIHELHSQGVQYHELIKRLTEMDIQPTLTAHPTEARRRSVLYIQREIDLVIRMLASEQLSKKEENECFDKLYHQVLLLLNTDYIRSSNLTVKDEIANGLFFLTSTIWDVVPDIMSDLRYSIEEYYNQKPIIPPILKYRTWIGGDRDGNPKVTADITEYAFNEHRRAALTKYKESLILLRRELSISDRQTQIPEWFKKHVLQDVISTGVPEAIRETYKHELFRLKINAILKKMDTLSFKDPSSLNEPNYHASHLLQDLNIIKDGLTDCGLGHIAENGLLARLLNQVHVFGFHIASIDIRQHSQVFEKTVAQMLSHANVHNSYAQLDESQKMAILTSELINPRPLIPVSAKLDSTSRELLQTFHTIRRLYETDTNSIGSVIVSMTHDRSDIFEVMLVAKETGLWKFQNNEVTSPLDIVPLFEVIDDLKTSHLLMDDLFSLEIYSKHLKARNNFQEIMLGYSDSNKDGGYWMANWSLHKAQKSLSKICIHHNVDFRLFHGRGGTVGRGGGRANHALLAMPGLSHNGKIRFTEQGEVISFRYAVRDLAHRHLEQMVNAVIKTSGSPAIRPFDYENDTYQMMEKISEKSMSTYRSLIDHPEFWKWYTGVTPIEHISRLPIASRPVSRKSKGEVDFNSLRAIPWVFAWTQLRYNVPGWFGIGSALKHALDTYGIEPLQILYKEWAFFKAVVDNAQREMARANFSISEVYTTEHDPEFHKLISSEYAIAASSILAITGFQSLLEQQPVIKKSIELRNPYTDVLNIAQVEAIKRWKLKRSDGMRQVIFQSINGIAAAMQSTG